MPPRFLAQLVAAFVLSSSVILGAEHRVSSPAEIAVAANKLQPGDTLIIADGTWSDQAIVFAAKGTAESPITLCSATPGGVILTGESSLRIDGEHLVVSGLWFRAGAKAKDGIAVTGKYCRLTDCAVTDGTYRFFVHLFGVENRVDRCYLAGKTSEGPTLQVEADGTPNRHRIDHNHFGPRPPLGRNGGETIRIGYSGQSMNDSGTLVESNLFSQCDGELEIISNKSCGNIYRGNTFLECAGMFTFRHGNKCRAEANFIIGNHKRGSGGFRVIGEDHVIVNNYIEGVTQGAFWITAGIVDSPLNGYFAARRCLIAHNTVIDSAGPLIDLAAGFGSSRRTLMPEAITIANNLFMGRGEGPLSKGKQGEGFRWLGNITSLAIPAMDGVRSAEVAGAKGSDGVWRPAKDSPVRGAAAGGFGELKTDLDGQPRLPPLDIGCDQLSDAPITNRPLTNHDVGPSWRIPTSS